MALADCTLENIINRKKKDNSFLNND